jgi:hypothetical protein
MGSPKVMQPGPGRRVAAFWVALAVALCALALSVPTARAYVYWSDNGAGIGSEGTTISRVDLDGSSLAPSLVSGAIAPGQVIVDGSHIYWTNANGANSIGRANLDGSGATNSFIPNATSGSPSAKPFGLAADAGHIYWSDGERYIGRADLGGTNVLPHWQDVGSGSFPFGIALDAVKIYVASGDQIDTVPIGGGAVTPLVTGLPSGTEPVAVALGGGYVYWTELNTFKGGVPGIARAPLAGSPVKPNLITGLGFPTGIATDGNTLYWADHTTGDIGRAQLDSSGAFNIEPTFATDPGGPFGVAFDSRIDPTSTAVACTPSAALMPGTDTVCKATVADSASTTVPAGSVVFSTASLAATFVGGNSCTLSAMPGGGASCTVGVAAVSAGTAQINAAYAGDALHQASSGSASICIGTTAQCGVPAAATATTTITTLLPTASAPTCKVPKVAGKSLRTAVRLIKRASCAIGKVTKPKARKGQKLRPLIAKSTSPRPGKTVARGTKVLILLVQKPKPKPKR